MRTMDGELAAALAALRASLAECEWSSFYDRGYRGEDMTETFNMHCVVELFGHSQIAGRVTEQQIGGASFIRVDVPATSRRDGFTKFYGPGAIYAITPVDEAVARAMAEGLNEAPIQEWRLKTIEPERQLPEPDPDTYGDEGDHFIDDDEPEWAKDAPFQGASVDDGEGEDDPEPLGVLADDQTDKMLAITWARELLEGEFVVFDTETTGIDESDEIIQIGVVDHTGAVVLDQFIKPTQPIRNTRHHGITDEMVQDAPGFPEVYEQIRTALEGKRAVAYNYEYDRRMLDQVCRKHGLPLLDWQPGEHCAMHQYAAFHGEWNDYHGNYRWKKLAEAVAALGLTFEGDAHNAAVDARATLAVIRKIAAAADTPF